VREGAAPTAAGDLVNSSRSLYSQALTAYNAGNYERTMALSFSSLRTTSAAREMVMAERGDTAPTIDGLTPPPAAEADDAREPANHELNRTYRDLQRAQRMPTQDQSAKHWIDFATTTYKSALAEYDAGKFVAAMHHAHAATDAAGAVAAFQHAVIPAQPRRQPQPPADDQ
jgi:hypothetical protein